MGVRGGQHGPNREAVSLRKHEDPEQECAKEGSSS